MRFIIYCTRSSALVSSPLFFSFLPPFFHVFCLVYIFCFVFFSVKMSNEVNITNDRKYFLLYTLEVHDSKHVKMVLLNEQKKSQRAARQQCEQVKVLCFFYCKISHQSDGIFDKKAARSQNVPSPHISASVHIGLYFFDLRKNTKASVKLIDIKPRRRIFSKELEDCVMSFFLSCSQNCSSF